MTACALWLTPITGLSSAETVQASTLVTTRLPLYSEPLGHTQVRHPDITDVDNHCVSECVYKPVKTAGPSTLAPSAHLYRGPAVGVEVLVNSVQQPQQKLLSVVLSVPFELGGVF